MLEKGSGDYRDAFVSLLNNRDKTRKAGFVTFVHGATSLAPIEALCLEQTYNKCRTARYSASPGPVLLPLVGAFLDDVRHYSEEAAGNETNETVDAFQPLPTEGGWEPIFGSLQEHLLIRDRSLDEGLRLLDSFFTSAKEVLDAGDRLVLLCEISDLDEKATLEDIGLDKEVIAFLGDLLPERLGIVFSGIPPHLEIPEFGDRFLGLNVSDQDYGAQPVAEERGQPLKNDAVKGEDELQIKSEVHALADAIASKDMHPPLVTGILGGWGSGKSFVLHLLKKRLLDIRCEDVSSKEQRENSPYAGHFYFVHFNAWTYAKSNLWASLMQEILVELNHQIGVEQLLEEAKQGVLLSGAEPWRLLQGLRPQDFAQLKESEIGLQAINQLRALGEAKLDHTILWKKLRNLKGEERKALDGAELELLEKQRALAEAEAWEPFQHKLFGKLGELFREAVDKTTSTEGMSLSRAVGTIQRLKKLWAGGSQRTIAFVAFAVLSLVAGLFIDQTSVRIASFLGTAAGPFLALWDAMKTANSWLDTRMEEFEASVQLAQEERAAGIKRPRMFVTVGASARVAALEQEISELEAKIDRHRRNVGITARHATLLDFIQGRLDRGDYEKHLGLLHQVQQDIEELSSGLFSHHRDESSNLFPRGEPRVILVIDDLDRCPPERVVEVLEAAKLLVGTSLFVVLLAMDVRYITRSLEKAYEGVLVRDGTPSGLDYIEKIVQIPYRVPPIAPNAMRGYLLSQLELGSVPLDQQRGQPIENDNAGGGSFAVISPPGDSTAFLDTSLPTEVQKFSPGELDLLEKCTLAVEISPRATKRLVNVVKLIKIIWYRRGEHKPDLDVMQAMVLMLTLAAAFPEVMRRLLLELENCFQRNPDDSSSDELGAMLGRNIILWSEREGRSTDWETVDTLIQDEGLLDPKLTIENVGLGNIQLVRSFSFVGEVDSPPDPETHQLAVDVLDPVTVITTDGPDDPGGDNVTE